MTRPRIVALVPARSGSNRVKGKNIKRLSAHPLLGYTISEALCSGIFSDVIVSTDSEEYSRIAEYYGAKVPVLRPREISGPASTDYEWIRYTLEYLEKTGKTYTHFSILRPTSPFRRASTIQKCWKAFSQDGGADSIRAVEKCSQHPAKMWTLSGNRMTPLFPEPEGETPYHSRQYPSLPETYVQNASLEIANTSVIFEQKTISGKIIMPYISEGLEGFDINYDMDWEIAEMLISKNPELLPHMTMPPYPN